MLVAATVLRSLAPALFGGLDGLRAAADGSGRVGRSLPYPTCRGVWMAFAVENPAGTGNTPQYSAEGQVAADEIRAQFSELLGTGACATVPACRA